MHSPEPYTLSELLVQFRARAKLSQQALARQVGVHRNTIVGWEQGNYLPKNRPVVQTLAEVLLLSEQEAASLLQACFFSEPVLSEPGDKAPDSELVPSLWQVPYQRNPLFTGREEILELLHETLCRQETMILSQSYALCGLGGIGKTQTAIEYAYRYANEYAAVFWTGAETYERIAADFLTVAEVLSLPERQEPGQGKVMAAVQRWLSSHRDWLLVFDNVEDLELVKRVLPAARCGAVLLTTRLQALGVAAQTIDLEKMSMEEGVRFLLRRAKVDDDEQLSPADEAAAREIIAVMDGLPLALDQAGAYIEATRCSLLEYLHLFQSHPIHLLSEREAHADHPTSVARTFALAFEQLQQRNAVAAELLTVCAYLSPDAIPEELFIEGASQLGPAFEHIASNPLQFHAAIKDLLAYSLIHRNAGNKTLMVHRLVQAVLKASMQETVQRGWVKHIIKALNELFPSGEIYAKPWSREHWSQSDRLLPQALEGVSLSTHWNLTIPEASSLPIKAAVYLFHRARFVEAEPLLQQALLLRERTLGPQHPDVAQPLYELGCIYYEQGKNAQAEPLLQRALRILEQALGSEHPSVAHPLHHLGCLYAYQSKYAQAEPLLLRALYIWEQALGPEHPSVIDSLNNLGSLYICQSRYAEAEPLLQRALRIWEQELGSQHSDNAHTLNSLGLLSTHQGKYTEAEAFLLRALRIWEQELGSEHPYVAYPLNYLGFLYNQQGKYAQAEPLLLRALHLLEQAMGPEHPDIAHPLNHLAFLSMRQGKYTEAELLLQRALHIQEQSLDSNHIEIAESLSNLAELYHIQGKLAEAEPLYRRALAIREQQLGQQNEKTVETRERYTALLRAMHQSAEATATE